MGPSGTGLAMPEVDSTATWCDREGDPSVVHRGRSGTGRRCERLRLPLGHDGAGRNLPLMRASATRRGTVCRSPVRGCKSRPINRVRELKIPWDETPCVSFHFRRTKDCGHAPDCAKDQGGGSGSATRVEAPSRTLMRIGRREAGRRRMHAQPGIRPLLDE